MLSIEFLISYESYQEDFLCFFNALKNCFFGCVHLLSKKLLYY